MRRIPLTLIVGLGTGLGLPILTLIGIYIGVLPPVSGLLTLFVVLVAVFWPLRKRAAQLLLVFVSVFLASVIVGSPPPRLTSEPFRSETLRHTWAETADLDASLPVFFHLVFER